MDIDPLEIDDIMNTIDRVLLLCPAAGAGAGEEEDALPTYKDAFPPLPEKMPSSEGPQDTANAWNKIRPLKSSIITQVRWWCSWLKNTHLYFVHQILGFWMHSYY